MIFSICNANGMTPGRPPQVEAPTAAQALEFWAKSRGVCGLSSGQGRRPQQTSARNPGRNCEQAAINPDILRSLGPGQGRQPNW